MDSLPLPVSEVLMEDLLDRFVNLNIVLLALKCETPLELPDVFPRRLAL